MKRREYNIEPIIINRIKIEKVIIDSHYELKHGSYITDDLVIELVKKLNGRVEVAEVVEDGFSYFATLVEYEYKQYRLVWLLENAAIYIGIINAYRDDRKE